jgi:hypothetical protein
MQMIIPKLVDSQVASVAEKRAVINERTGKMQISLTILRVAVTASIVARQLLHVPNDGLL